MSDIFHLSLLLPDGTEYAYGDVSPGTLPAVGEVIWFQRTDPLDRLMPDEGLEGTRWLVLGREWSVRIVGTEMPYHVTFLTLRLGEVTPTTLRPS